MRVSSRAILVGVLLALSLSMTGAAWAKPALKAKPASKAKPALKSKRVLFVCTGNFYRSRFAESVFNAVVSSPWRAFSRGLDTSTPREVPVSPLVTAELARRQIALSDGERFPAQLEQADIDAADLIVLMDKREHEGRFWHQFPSAPKQKVRAWDVADIQDLAPELAFAALDERVVELEHELR